VNAEAVVQALRKHIGARRLEIAEKFPKRLSPQEYERHCGRHEELESLAAVFQEAIKKANSAESDDDTQE
jgi:CRISPR/Cas system CSM-associated protein Csm2 small subunit